MIKIKFKAVAIMLVAALVFWIGDAIGDYYCHKEFPFLNHLIFGIDGELHDRLIAIIIMLLLSIVLSRYITKLNKSEGRYRQLFDHINDAILVQPVASANNPARFIDANQSAYQKLGYSPNELLRLSPADLIPAEKSQELAALMQRLLVEKQAFFEICLQDKAGNRIPVEINARIYDRGPGSTILWEAHDIAERKRAEVALRKAKDNLEARVIARTAELAEANVTLSREIEERKHTEQVLAESTKQLRVCTSRLMSAEERERQRISAELHDELGQSLTLLKFRITSLKKSSDKDSQVFEEDCESLLHYVDATIENVRRISQDLSPTIVTEFGLAFALEYLFEEFREHYDPSCCSIEMDEIDKHLAQQVQVNIYRIFQEILTNAFKHGKATSLRRSSEKTRTIAFTWKIMAKVLMLGEYSPGRLCRRGPESPPCMNGALDGWQLRFGQSRECRYFNNLQYSVSRNTAMILPYKILLADDHTMVREAIARTIEDNPGLLVVGEVSNGLELLDFLKKTAVDLVVLDITMPYLQGLEAAKEIKLTHPEVKILILTMHKSKGHIYQALLAGADGYLLKENACADLITAINTIRQGQHYVSSLISGHLTDIFRKNHGPGQMPIQEQLTAREQEILSLLSTSKSAKQISEILSISAMTVYNHISNIKKKLNINNNIDLIKYAIQTDYTALD